MPEHSKISFPQELIDEYRKCANRAQDIRQEVADKVKAAYPWMKDHWSVQVQPTCHDCGAFIGEEHKEGCDCEKGGGDRWTGIMYPEAVEYALNHDLFSHMVRGLGWVPGSRDDLVSKADINEAMLRMHDEELMEELEKTKEERKKS